MQSACEFLFSPSFASTGILTMLNLALVIFAMSMSSGGAKKRKRRRRKPRR